MHSATRPLICALVIVGFTCFGQPAGQPVPEKKSTAELEAKLMAQFKAFAIRKRDYAKKVAAEKQVKPPELVWNFFDSAIAGDFVEAQKQFQPLALMSGQYDSPPPLLGEAFWAKARPRIEKLFEVDLLARWRESIARHQQLNKEAFNVFWVLVNEVHGAMKELDSWHADYLQIYTENIVQSIPRNAIYFGGTDPGRYAITLGSKSHEKADPFFTITQNQLADGRYLQYLKRLYGKRIYTPSVEDNKAAFSEYYSSARKRLMNGTLQPGEDVRLTLNFQCPNCLSTFPQVVDRNTAPLLKQIEQIGSQPCPKDQTPMPIPEPQVSVQGTTAVMDINAKLARTIFDKNPDHDFYLEESFPLNWMYPHLVPHGLIFKLERKTLKELPPDLIARNRKDWQEYMALCVGGAVVKPETTVAELCRWVETIYIKGDRENFKGDALFLKSKKEMRGNENRKGPPYSEQMAFSKMRSAQATLYFTRKLNTKDIKLKKEYAREADYAYRQAFALGPINPETVFRFSSFLTTMNRHDSAMRVAETYRSLKPKDPKSLIFVRQVMRTSEQQLAAARNFEGAIAIVERLDKVDPKADHLIRRDYYKREIEEEGKIINAFAVNPSNSTNFVQAVYIHGRVGRTNEVLTAINTYSPLAGEDPKNLTLIKNAYGLIHHWKEKALIDEKLIVITPNNHAAWFDLAKTRLQLHDTKRAALALKKALTLFENGEKKPSELDIFDEIRTNSIFAPLREHPEIKPFLIKNE